MNSDSHKSMDDFQPQTLLLSDPSPCLRYLVLKELLKFPGDHPEMRELASMRLEDPLIRDLLTLQQADGSWSSGEMVGSSSGTPIQATCQALLRLAYLGFDASLPAVANGANFLFLQQESDGSWPAPVHNQGEAEIIGYSMIPLQTALPLRCLAACGYATDPRAQKAFTWLLVQRLEDGAWPTGLAFGVYGYVAGYRRLPHSRWGCRSNTTGALLCLSLHPDLRHGPEAQHALDLLLGRETREKYILGYEVARMLGAETTHGFITYYARFDLAMILSLCARVGVSKEDPRLIELVEFIHSLQGAYGLWEYPARPQVSRWLTLDILRSLSSFEDTDHWLNLEPRTPFQGYPNKPRRY